jgi:hypothetical protein
LEVSKNKIAVGILPWVNQLPVIDMIVNDEASIRRLIGRFDDRVSVDGIEIVASLVLLAHRRAGARVGWPPWAALVAGPAASIAVAACRRSGRGT